MAFKASKLSHGSLAQLQIKDEDQLTPDDLEQGDFIDHWIRVRVSSESHKLGPDLRTARCGFPLDLWSDWWENSMRPVFKHLSGTDPGDWFMVEETRQDGKCKACKGKYALTDAKFEEYEVHVPEPIPTRSIAKERSPAQERASQQFLSKVAWLAGELNGELI